MHVSPACLVTACLVTACVCARVCVCLQTLEEAAAATEADVRCLLDRLQLDDREVVRMYKVITRRLSAILDTILPGDVPGAPRVEARAIAAAGGQVQAAADASRAVPGALGASAGVAAPADTPDNLGAAGAAAGAASLGAPSGQLPPSAARAAALSGEDALEARRLAAELLVDYPKNLLAQALELAEVREGSMAGLTPRIRLVRRALQMAANASLWVDRARVSAPYMQRWVQRKQKAAADENDVVRLYEEGVNGWQSVVDQAKGAADAKQLATLETAKQQLAAAQAKAEAAASAATAAAALVGRLLALQWKMQWLVERLTERHQRMLAELPQLEAADAAAATAAADRRFAELCAVAAAALSDDSALSVEAARAQMAAVQAEAQAAIDALVAHFGAGAQA